MESSNIVLMLETKEPDMTPGQEKRWFNENKYGFLLPERKSKSNCPYPSC